MPERELKVRPARHATAVMCSVGRPVPSFYLVVIALVRLVWPVFDLLPVQGFRQLGKGVAQTRRSERHL